MAKEKDEQKSEKEKATLHSAGLEAVEVVAMVALLSATCAVVPIGNAAQLACLCLWIGFGHAVLFYLNLYPKQTLRPMGRGALAYVLGILWPVWVICFRRRIST